jgi:tetratricopeptide (TPR) repeat protein
LNSFPYSLRVKLANGHSSILRETGQRKRSLDVARLAYELSEQDDNFKLNMSSLVSLAINLRANGEYEEAENLYERGIEFCRSRGARRPYLICLGNLANLITSARHDYERAEQLLIEVVHGNRETGAMTSEALATGNLAANWLAVGRLSASAFAYGIATELAARVGYPLLEARSACFHAESLVLLGRQQDAEERIKHGMACLEGRDQGKFQLEFGELCNVQIQLANVERHDRLELATKAVGRMREIAERSEVDNYGQGTLKHAERIKSELEEAQSENRAPRIIRGHLPAYMKPGQCAAMLDILGDRENPEGIAVWDELVARADGTRTPDWQNDARARLLLANNA